MLWLKTLLGSPNDSAVAGALNTIAVLLVKGSKVPGKKAIFRGFSKVNGPWSSPICGG